MKWRATPALIAQVMDWSEPLRIGGHRVKMDARYYDTADGFLASIQAGLRLRLENDVGVCCLKCGGSANAEGLHVREEYECRASSIVEGLLGLAATDAPPLVCAALRQKGVIEICRVQFSRMALDVSIPTPSGEDLVVAELSFDHGTLCGNGRKAPLCEIELEFKSGDAQAFDALARAIASQFSLVPEPLSKLARAAAL